MNPRNLLSEWSRLLMGSLARAGVEQVVVSPGSRSTPFLWAAINEPGLSLDVIVDERSAGFYAVAQAKVSGRPSLLLCTSGSAGANYFPAIVEAQMTGTPLIVMTADRPFELQGCAAPQTIDQIRLFGHHVRRYFELGLPDADLGALRGLMRTTTQAVHAARHPEPGPVHLNVRAKKPLEPQAADDGEGRELTERVSALLGNVTSASPPPLKLPDEAALRRIARSCMAAQRGLLVCGGIVPAQAALREPITRLLEQLKFPVLCEAPSQLRIAPSAPRLAPLICDAFDVVLGSPSARRELAPDLVLQIGAPCTSGMLEKYLAENAGVERHVIAELGWPDPQSSAASITIGDVGVICERLTQELERAPRPNADQQAAFCRSFNLANAVVWNVIESELGGHSALSEGGATRITLDLLPERSLLALGNSLPIREVDIYCRARSADVLVFTQRGTNGIDGLISGAAGAAASSARPTTLLVGDLSFLHDVGGLFAARSLRLPFVVVVLNNDGGRIFELLPLASAPGMSSERLQPWIVSHGLELKSAAELYRHHYARVERADQLRAALREAHGRQGCTVVEVVVSPQGAVEQLGRVRQRAEAALAHLFGSEAAR